MPLSLARGLAISVLTLAIACLFRIKLLPQAFQIEVAQRIGTEAAGLEVFVASNVRDVLQQVGNPAEDGRAYAIGM